MRNFTYYNPTKIQFGRGMMRKLERLIDTSDKILLMAGGGSIKMNGVYDQVSQALKDHSVHEFWGISPNPQYETCMEAVEVAKKNKIDFFLSVGGGSVLDATKFVAAACYWDGDDPWDFMERGDAITKAAPLGCVLTLPATGSESNGNAVISRRSSKQKLAFSSPFVMPRFAILDPETTFSLSERQTANGIVDAFAHVVEQYLTFDVNTPLQDRQAEAILKTLAEEGPLLMSSPSDYDLRANIMWCATSALNTSIACGVVQDWSTHMIGHELTVITGLDHAQTLAIVMPALLRHQRRPKQTKLAQYGRRVWDLTGDDETVALAAVDKTESFFRSLGVGTKLSDYQIKSEDCLMAADRLAARVTAVGEHSDIGRDEIEAILRSAA